MVDRMPEWMRRAFSKPRLKSYLRATGGDPQAAMRLYWWNVDASAALYAPLQCVELAVRNALHDSLVRAYGRPDWWTVAPLDRHGRRLVAKARDKCHERLDGRRRVTADDVVTELTFGFWANLLARGYVRSLWVPTLHKAFPRAGRRDDLYDDLWAVVCLRNRVMHHKPIHDMENLAADHASIYRVLDALGADLAKEVRALDRFPSVLASREDPGD
ncbi:hypothetical protein [Streptomyces ipomoeae]|uniref:hypothetical protein n=1 Tax=Streptomyces ipomoeae TaxID=103232 RepID=UPI001146DCA4|nr:hypothetical protein [Streptomyces ipomoeae]MDX2938006.1 hypothetical protein [Streptomyces ipomoeae]TQE20770.1 hypothetical protein SipoB123_27760 [Streptomyces ipomoeae]